MSKKQKTRRIPEWLKDPTIGEMAMLFEAWGFYIRVALVSKENWLPQQEEKPASDTGEGVWV